LALPFHWVSGIKEAYKGLLNGDILEGVKIFASQKLLLCSERYMKASRRKEVQKYGKVNV